MDRSAQAGLDTQHGGQGELGETRTGSWVRVGHQAVMGGIAGVQSMIREDIWATSLLEACRLHS